MHYQDKIGSFIFLLRSESFNIRSWIAFVMDGDNDELEEEKTFNIFEKPFRKTNYCSRFMSTDNH